MKPNPILLIVGGFLHRENTAERTTSTAGQPAGSIVVHGHSPPPVPPVSQLETVIHGHSPPPVPPFSQPETVIHFHSPPPVPLFSQLETVIHGHQPTTAAQFFRVSPDNCHNGCSLSSTPPLVSCIRREHITPLLRELHWLQVPERIQFRLCVLTFSPNTRDERRR